MADVVGLGSPVMDLLVNLPSMPQGDGFMRAEGIFHQGGGKAATGVAATARLGVSSGMMAKVGADYTGDFIIRDFVYNGVDVSRIIRGEPGSNSPYCVALSARDTGSRCFISKSKPNAVGRIKEGELDYSYLASAKALLIESGDPASAAAARFCRENHIAVCVDADGYSKEIEDLLPSIDIFIGSSFYYQKRFEGCSLLSACESVRRAGPQTVWFTLGADGCFGLVDGKQAEIPAYTVPVKDTTGAGDVFHGAYLAEMMTGASHEECARFASAVAAIKCMFVGGRTGIPTRGIAERFMREGTIDIGAYKERLEYYQNNV